MNENENMETVENYDQEASVDVRETDDPVLSDSTGTGSGMGQDAGSVAEEPSIDDYLLDGDGNYVLFTVSGSDASLEQVQVQNLSTDDFEPYFSAVNYRLDIIIFLLLFYWCARKIKIAVANFTGRSLDNGKDVL